MTTIVLHDDAFDELNSAFIDSGLLEAPDWIDEFTIGEITYKRWRYEPTAEDIARRDAFMASPLGKLCADMFSRNNKYLESIAKDIVSDHRFTNGEQWPGGTELKIRLPSDFTVNE